MSIYSTTGSRLNTPQSRPIPGRSDMVKNAAGGYVFQVDPWDQLDRFLILGTEGGTYYVSQAKLTRENLGAVEALIAQDGARVVQRIVEISDSGRAVRNSPAIWAIAACSVLGDDTVKAAANKAMPKVVRTGSHLFEWAECMKQLATGWGRGVKRSINRWYLERAPSSLLYQLMKYRQREGWAHRDVLRLGHVGSPALSPGPLAGDNEGDALLRKRYLAWAAGKGDVKPDILSGDRLAAFEDLRQIGDSLTAAQAVKAIRTHRFTHEMLPTHVLRDAGVWEALLAEMPVGAMLRNLGRMSAVGLLKPLSAAERVVCDRLRDPERVRRSRMHPAAVLQAMKVYAQGRGVKGSLKWHPAAGVKGALEDTFDLAFENVEPSGKRILLGVDASGSMASSWGGGVVGLNMLLPVEGASAMAMAVARREARHHIVAFDMNVYATHINSRTSMPEAMAAFRHGAATDGSAPIRWAEQNRVEVDAFVIMTDNETWAGARHPCQALRSYRQTMGINARMVVVGMCASGNTFADPKDALTMDVVGFDAAAPRVISDFCRG